MVKRNRRTFIAIFLAAALLTIVHVVGGNEFSGVAVGVGTLALGGAAIWSAHSKANEAVKKIDEIEVKVNGGLERAAKEHMRIAELEAREAGDYVSMLELAREFEKQRNDCHDKIDAIYQRLDEIGVGRNAVRE